MSVGILERRCRRLLRDAHGDELVATLLETAEPGRVLPSARESLSLVVGGLRTRVIHRTGRPVWTDGVHLGVIALPVAHLATLLLLTTAAVAMPYRAKRHAVL